MFNKNLLINKNFLLYWQCSKQDKNFLINKRRFCRASSYINFFTFKKSSLNTTFFNFTFDKGRLKNLVSWTLQNYGHYKTVQLLEQLKKTGFEYATKAGISLGIDDLKIPPKKKTLLLSAEQLTKLTRHQYERADITAVERFQRLIDTWHRTSEQLKQEVINYFEETDILNPVYMMAFSGARGNISQVRQLVGMRGLMSDPQGQIIDFPIRSNFREGLTLTEYIISSYGARKGIVDTALRTANAGYLTRRLVDVAQHVIISHYDCGSQKGIFLTDMKDGNKTIVTAQSRIIGRVLGRDIYKPNSKIKIFSRNQEISTDVAFEVGKITNKIFVRSALTCNTTKLLCQLCYGWSLAQGNLVSVGETVGVIAAQSIGEPGTQLTMRTFHTGGVFSSDISDEIRAPFNGFVHYAGIIPGILMRSMDGKILFLTKADGTLIFSKNYLLDISEDSLSLLKDVNKIKKYKIPAYTILFFRNGESIIHKQVVAQITTISTKLNTCDTAQLVIKSELEGLFYAKTLQVQKEVIGPKPKFVNDSKNKIQTIEIDPKAMEIVVKARGWNFAWVLSGKRYEIPLLLNTFPKIGDFITPQTVITSHNFKLPSSYKNSIKFSFKKINNNPILQKNFNFYDGKFAYKQDLDNFGKPNLYLQNLPTWQKHSYIKQENGNRINSLKKIFHQSLGKSGSFNMISKKSKDLKNLLTKYTNTKPDLLNIVSKSHKKFSFKSLLKQDLLSCKLQKIKYHKIAYFHLFNTKTFLNLIKSDNLLKFTLDIENILLVLPTSLKPESITKTSISLKRLKSSNLMFFANPLLRVNKPSFLSKGLLDPSMKRSQKVFSNLFFSKSSFVLALPTKTTNVSSINLINKNDSPSFHQNLSKYKSLIFFKIHQKFYNNYIYKATNKKKRDLVYPTRNRLTKLNKSYPFFKTKEKSLQNLIFLSWFKHTCEKSKITHSLTKKKFFDLLQNKKNVSKYFCKKFYTVNTNTTYITTKDKIKKVPTIKDILFRIYSLNRLVNVGKANISWLNPTDQNKLRFLFSKSKLKDSILLINNFNFSAQDKPLWNNLVYTFETSSRSVQKINKKILKHFTKKYVQNPFDGNLIFSGLNYLKPSTLSNFKKKKIYNFRNSNLKKQFKVLKSFASAKAKKPFLLRKKTKKFKYMLKTNHIIYLYKKKSKENNNLFLNLEYFFKVLFSFVVIYKSGKTSLISSYKREKNSLPLKWRSHTILIKKDINTTSDENLRSFENFQGFLIYFNFYKTFVLYLKEIINTFKKDFVFVINKKPKYKINSNNKYKNLFYYNYLKYGLTNKKVNVGSANLINKIDYQSLNNYIGSSQPNASLSIFNRNIMNSSYTSNVQQSSLAIRRNTIDLVIYKKTKNEVINLRTVNLKSKTCVSAQIRATKRKSGIFVGLWESLGIGIKPNTANLHQFPSHLPRLFNLYQQDIQKSQDRLCANIVTELPSSKIITKISKERDLCKKKQFRKKFIINISNDVKLFAKQKQDLSLLPKKPNFALLKILDFKKTKHLTLTKSLEKFKNLSIPTLYKNFHLLIQKPLLKKDKKNVLSPTKNKINAKTSDQTFAIKDNIDVVFFTKVAPTLLSLCQKLVLDFKNQGWMSELCPNPLTRILTQIGEEPFEPLSIDDTVILLAMPLAGQAQIDKRFFTFNRLKKINSYFNTVEPILSFYLDKPIYKDSFLKNISYSFSYKAKINNLNFKELLAAQSPNSITLVNTNNCSKIFSRNFVERQSVELCPSLLQSKYVVGSDISSLKKSNQKNLQYKKIQIIPKQPCLNIYFYTFLNNKNNTYYYNFYKNFVLYRKAFLNKKKGELLYKKIYKNFLVSNPYENFKIGLKSFKNLSTNVSNQQSIRLKMFDYFLNTKVKNIQKLVFGKLQNTVTTPQKINIMPDSKTLKEDGHNIKLTKVGKANTMTSSLHPMLQKFFGYKGWSRLHLILTKKDTRSLKYLNYNKMWHNLFIKTITQINKENLYNKGQMFKRSKPIDLQGWRRLIRPINDTVIYQQNPNKFGLNSDNLSTQITFFQGYKNQNNVLQYNVKLRNQWIFCNLKKENKIKHIIFKPSKSGLIWQNQPLTRIFDQDSTSFMSQHKGSGKPDKFMYSQPMTISRAKLGIKINTFKKNLVFNNHFFKNTSVLNKKIDYSMKKVLLVPYMSCLNSLWINYKQKNVKTKNKVGFFFLKGNTFLNSATKLTISLEDLELIEDSRQRIKQHNNLQVKAQPSFLNLRSGLHESNTKVSKNLDLNQNIFYKNSYVLRYLISNLRYFELKNLLNIQKIHLNQHFLHVINSRFKFFYKKQDYYINIKKEINFLYTLKPEQSSAFLKPINSNDSFYYKVGGIMVKAMIEDGLLPALSREFSSKLDVRTSSANWLCQSLSTYKHKGTCSKVSKVWQSLFNPDFPIFIGNFIFTKLKQEYEKPKQKIYFQVIKKSGQLIHMNYKKICIRIGQPLVISPLSIIHATHGDFILNKTAVITLTYQQLKTGDIVQGIPKIEQLFESRSTKRGRLFRDNVTNVLTGLFLKFFIKSMYLLRINNKQNPTRVLALALQWSVKQSFYKIQQIIVDGILRVYRSQGVSIADKHVEIIVKQMTSKVRIINANTTKISDYLVSLQHITRGLETNSDENSEEFSHGEKLLDPDKSKTVIFSNKLVEKLFDNNLDSPPGLFPGEIVDIDFVENINLFLLKTSNKDYLKKNLIKIEPIKYEPIVLGITRASLEVDSFLSAASFQQTTRVLSQAALYKKKDFLKGLKENIIIGNLIPAGTGYLSSLKY